MQSIASSNLNNSSSKKRGRPPGSKNKPKSETSGSSPDFDQLSSPNLPPISNSKHKISDSQKRRPGRPPKVKSSNGSLLLSSHESFNVSPSQDPIHSDTDADSVLHLHSPIGGRSPLHSHESPEDETAAAVSTLFKNDCDGHGDSGVSLQLTLTPLLPTGPVSSPTLASSDPIVNQLRLLNEGASGSANARASFIPTSCSTSLQPANSATNTCSGSKFNGPPHSDLYRPPSAAAVGGGGSSLNMITPNSSSFNATSHSNLACDPACSTVPKPNVCNSVCKSPHSQSLLAQSDAAFPSPSSLDSKSCSKLSSRRDRKANRVRDRGSVAPQANASDPEFDVRLEALVARLQKLRIAGASGKQPNGVGSCMRANVNGSPLSPPPVSSCEPSKFNWTRSLSSPAGATCASSSESCCLHAFNNFVVDLLELHSHLMRLNEEPDAASTSEFNLRKPLLEREELLLRNLHCTSDKFTSLFGKPKSRTTAKTQKSGERSVSPTRSSASHSSHIERREVDDSTPVLSEVVSPNCKSKSRSKKGTQRSKSSLKSKQPPAATARPIINIITDSESSKNRDRRSSSSSSYKRSRALKEEANNRSASNSPLRAQSSSPSPSASPSKSKGRKSPKISLARANNSKKKCKSASKHDKKSKESTVAQKPASSPPHSPPSPPPPRSPSPDHAKSAQASRRQRDNKGRFAPEPSGKPAAASRSNSREPLHIDVRRSTSVSSLSMHDSKSPNKAKHKHHHRHHKSKSKCDQHTPDAEQTALLEAVSPETVTFDDFVESLKVNNVVSKLDARALRKARKSHSKSPHCNDRPTAVASVAIPGESSHSSTSETLSRKELRAILSAATAAQIQSTASARRTKEVASLVSSLAAPSSPLPPSSSQTVRDKKKQRQQQSRHKRKSDGSGGVSVGSPSELLTCSPPPVAIERSTSAASGAGSVSSSSPTSDEPSGAVGALPPKKRFKSRPPRSSPPLLSPATELEHSPSVSKSTPAEDTSLLLIVSPPIATCMAWIILANYCFVT